MKPVSNWRNAWKWFSVQAMTLAGALQAGWLALPTSMQARVPAEWVDALTIAILVLGVIGRLVDQGEQP
jgi:hypothetical protein